jgi:hypothetical protein
MADQLKSQALRFNGFLFVATPDEVAAMNILVGPTRPMTAAGSKRPVPLRECSFPNTYPPYVFDILLSVLLPKTDSPKLKMVREQAPFAVYIFPKEATDLLSALTPDKADFTRQQISSIAEQMFQHPAIQERFKLTGVATLVLTVRGHALKAVPRSGPLDIYYWCSDGG